MPVVSLGDARPLGHLAPCADTDLAAVAEPANISNLANSWPRSLRIALASLPPASLDLGDKVQKQETWA